MQHDEHGWLGTGDGGLAHQVVQVGGSGLGVGRDGHGEENDRRNETRARDEEHARSGLALVPHTPVPRMHPTQFALGLRGLQHPFGGIVRGAQHNGHFLRAPRPMQLEQVIE